MQFCGEFQVLFLEALNFLVFEFDGGIPFSNSPLEIPYDFLQSLDFLILSLDFLDQFFDFLFQLGYLCFHLCLVFLCLHFRVIQLIRQFFVFFLLFSDEPFQFLFLGIESPFCLSLLSLILGC